MDRLSQLLTVGLREKWSVSQLADEIDDLYQRLGSRWVDRDKEYCGICGRQLLNGVCIKAPHSKLEGYENFKSEAE